MIARAAIGSGLLRIVNAGAGFAVAVVLARSLGATGYGIYTTALVIASSLAILVQFGLPNLVLRETAASAVAHDEHRMREVWRWASRRALVTSAIAMFLGGGVIAYLKRDAPPSEWLTYGLALALIPVIALGALRAGALQGLRHIVLAQLPEQLAKPGLMLVMALALGTLLPANPSVAMAMQFIAVTFAFVFGAILLWRKSPRVELEWRLTARHLPMPSLRAAAAFAMVAGATRINQYTDILALSAFSTSAEVGVYRAVWQTSLLIAFGNGVAAMVMPSLFARYHAQHDSNALSAALRNARIMGAAVALPPALILLFFGETVVGLAFGPTFSAGLLPLKILVVMQLTNAIAGPQGSYLNMTAREGISSRLHLTSAGLNLALNILLVPTLGATGAALATLISYMVLNATMAIVIHGRSN